MSAWYEVRVMGFSKFVMLLVFTLLSVGAWGTLAKAEKADEGLEVIRGFTEKAVEKSEAVKISDERKHEILFIMGILLLVGILTTAILGISMVLFGKQVFVAHMVFAGFSVFLSIAHAVTAIVWFYPF